ncbi:hypothetical protein HYW20_07695 [Candidatus Woesearchaeota archaeon]|nr:hypothetical protein [Candidatus Woesearchaeota archaeon]
MDKKIHVGMVVLLFILLSFFRQHLDFFRFGYGYGETGTSSLALVLYGVYLIFIVGLYLKNSFELWFKGDNWGRELLKSYGLLLLFATFIPLLMPLVYGNGNIFLDGISLEFLIYLPIVIVFGGFSIVLPIGIYSILLGITSLRRHKKSKKYSLTLIITGIVLFIISIPAFWAILQVWIAGGFRE